MARNWPLQINNVFTFISIFMAIISVYTKELQGTLVSDALFHTSSLLMLKPVSFAVQSPFIHRQRIPISEQ